MGMLGAIACFGRPPAEPVPHVVRDGSSPAPAPALAVRGAVRAGAKGARVALVTSLGYYGNASALVMRAPSR
jgi:hypothetical protein